MKVTKVTCDSCKKDITTCGNKTSYRLALHSEAVPVVGHFVTERQDPKMIEQSMHFCSESCFAAWAVPWCLSKSKEFASELLRVHVQDVP